MSFNSPDYHFGILSQLLQIVTSNGVGRTDFSIRVDTDDPDSAPLQEQLLAGVMNGSFRRDRDASRKLYNAEPTDQRYQTLRSRCIDRLLSEIRHIDVASSQLSERASNFHKCLDLMRAGSLLLSYGNSEAGAYSMNKAMLIAAKYDFTLIELATRIHLSMLSTSSRSEPSSKEHSEKIRMLILTLYWEHVSQASYDSLRLYGHGYEYHALRYAPPRPVNSSGEMLQVLSHSDEANRSFTLFVNRIRLQLDDLVSRSDYAAAEVLIDETLAFYSRNKKFHSRARIGELYIYKMEMLIKSRRILDSSEIVVPTKNFSVGKINWALSHTLAAYKYLYLNDVHRAFEAYLELRVHHSDDVHRTDVFEHRLLLEAYLWILASILPASEFGHEDPLSVIQFRDSTFLNTMRVLASHKKSTNALVVIAHAFALLIKGREREADRRITYLNVYASRYLKGESEQRLWHCVKAMQKIPEFRTRPRLLPDAMADSIARIRLLTDLPMKNGFNELVQWDVLLEAYSVWAQERSHRHSMK